MSNAPGGSRTYGNYEDARVACIRIK